MIMRLFRSLMPKEERFLDHFEAHAGRMVAAADALSALMEAPAERRAAMVEELGAIESQADEHARAVVVGLHRAFITPFDRGDIHALINAMDDAVDLMEEVPEQAALYRVEFFTPRMRELAAEIQKAARLLAEAIPLLRDISRNAARINDLCHQVGQIERAADRIERTALSELIAEQPETISFIGRRELYQLLETCTDRCDDVAEVIEGIVLDHV